MAPTSPEDQLAREFPLVADLVYLNHAAVAPWPKRTADAVNRFAAENISYGATHYAAWLAREQQLREQCARLINGRQADIAFAKNTSEALSIVAHGFPWQPGDNVVIPAGEFPSNRIVWQSLGKQGVEVREIAIAAVKDPEGDLLAATNDKTRLISVSSVQYATGLRLNLGRLGEACAKQGIAFCVDAIQGLGALPHDVAAMRIDFLAADAHKWLLGPEGIAVSYCSLDWRDRLTIHEFGWHMVEDAYNFDQPAWRPAADAKRFEPGSPNMLGIQALGASLSLLLETGIATVEKRVLERAEYLFQNLSAVPGIELLTRTEKERYAGIVTFRHKACSADDLFASLRAANVICAARGGGIRFSPHFYTPIEKLDHVMGLLRAI